MVERMEALQRAQEIGDAIGLPQAANGLIHVARRLRGIDIKLRESRR